MADVCYVDRPNPTHVGMHLWHSPLSRGPRAEPHARGDAPRGLMFRTLAGESAPHARECTARQGRRRITEPDPAHAGMKRSAAPPPAEDGRSAEPAPVGAAGSHQAPGKAAAMDAVERIEPGERRIMRPARLRISTGSGRGSGDQQRGRGGTEVRRPSRGFRVQHTSPAAARRRPGRGRGITWPAGRAHRARSLRRRRFAARNGLPAQDLSRVSGQRRRSARRGRFSAVGEPRAEFGPRGPQGPPEAALRVHLSPLRASCRASYAAVSTCRRLTLRARHTKSHSHRAFASPRRLKRRKPSTCLIQP